MGSLGGLLEGVWGPLGRRLGSFGGLSGMSWAVLGGLGVSWGLLGASWGRLGALFGSFWGSLGGSWGPLEGVLGRPWDVFFRLGPVLGAMWRMMSFLGWFRKALGRDFH